MAGATPFTVAGIEGDDNGSVSFSDGSHAPVVVSIANGVLAATTANLAALNDGTITATLHLDSDAAGNSFSNVVATALLDQDATEQAALSLTVNGGQPIGAAIAGAVPFTAVGFESDDNGSVSFSDGSHAPVVVSITNGVLAATTANLAGLNDGTITATLHLDNDAAGNSFTNVVATATLDRDIGEQAALKLTIGNTNIGSAAASAVPFTVAGLDLEDIGTVTFTDSNGKTITVNVSGAQTSYTAALTTLADGQITSQLSVNKDSAGNTFTPVAGNTVTLDQDTGQQFVVPSGLLGYWSLNGTTTDASGNGNNLSLFGGATYGSGQFGQALSSQRRKGLVCSGADEQHRI